MATVKETLEALKAKTKPVPFVFKINGTDVTFYFKPFTLPVRDQWETSVFPNDKTKARVNFRAKLLQLTLCEENGALCYTDPLQMSDLPQPDLEPVFEQALTFQGITKKEVDDKEKNLESQTTST